MLASLSLQMRRYRTRDVLVAPRAMLTELKLAPSDWIFVTPAVTTPLNFTSFDRLGAVNDGISRTPLGLLTGIRPTSPSLQVVPFDKFILKVKTIALARTTSVIHIEKLQKDLNDLQTSVAQRNNQRRTRTMASHNSANSILFRSFALGDLVSVRHAVA